MLRATPPRRGVNTWAGEDPPWERSARQGGVCSVWLRPSVSVGASLCTNRNKVSAWSEPAEKLPRLPSANSLPTLPVPFGMFPDITRTLRDLYLSDPRPWLVGFSGGKDSTLVAQLIFETVLALPAEQRTKRIDVLCTDTRVEIPAIVETIEGTLARMQRCADGHRLDLHVHLLRPPPEQSFWVNIIGRGYPPPNRFFR